jgi:hypothetical protein
VIPLDQDVIDGAPLAVTLDLKANNLSSPALTQDRKDLRAVGRGRSGDIIGYPLALADTITDAKLITGASHQLFRG